MAISELQMGLIGVGVAAVVGVVAYNKWQEGRHRRRAEKAFGEAHSDVLLEPGLREPAEGGGHDPHSAATQIVEPTHRATKQASARRGSPAELPAASELCDCVLRIESIEALSASKLLAAAAEAMGDIGKPLSWFGFDDANNVWVGIDRGAPGAYHWFAVALQLVDRRGPVGETELVRFFNGVQRVADQFMAVPAAAPTRNEVLTLANELDHFCAGVDVQIGLNIVAADSPFAGTKIRAFAEAQGWTLDEGGSYQAADSDGQALFSMSNLDGTPFSSAAMRELQTRGLTLLLDVPRTVNGTFAFDRMLASARQLADALGGQVVDDNRAAFGETEAHVIRGQVEQFQNRMTERGLAPGSELAERLFAA